MKRKLYAFFLTALICVASLPVFSQAAGTATLVDSGYCGATSKQAASWKIENIGSDQVLTFSGTGAISDYDGGPTPWSMYKESVTKIVVENGVTNVPGFFEWLKLKKVELADSVEQLESFGNCFYLESIVIPANVREIPRNMFVKCGIKSIQFNGSVSSIGDYAFSQCGALTEIRLPNGLTTIGNYAFAECGKLRAMYIPKSVIAFNGKPFAQNMGGHAGPRNIYYGGSEQDWSAIKNTELFTTEDGKYVYTGSANPNEKLATLHFESYEPEDPPTEPTASPEPDKKPQPDVVFDDVSSSAYYAKPVAWAVEQGITSGTSATTFSPNAPCTRGQIVTFLWRAAGSPGPSSDNNPFVDVKTSDYFYKPVLWAVENKITSGTDSNHFSPGKACTRAEAVTFLWRAAGSPSPNITYNPFNDVGSRAYYYSPVLWAASNGITAGTSKNSFGPNAKCNRGQIVTFLYRHYVEPSDIVPPEPDTSYLEPYAECLRNFRKKYPSIKESEFKFQLAFIDDDEIPELLAVAGSYFPSTVTVFSYVDGDVEEVGNFGFYGYMTYSERNGLICSTTTRMGYRDETFYTYSRGTARQIGGNFLAMDNTTGLTPAEKDKISYHINHEKVSKEVYDSQRNAIINGRTFIASKGHEMSEYNIKLMVANPKSAY